jgi:crossover junction endodeoxyribonuclease RuvC
MSAPHFIGGDIGVFGALGVVTFDGELVEVFDMPCLDDGPAGRRSINAALLAFAFGRCRGVIEGLFAALAIPVTFIAPPTWKRLVGIPRKDGAKEAARSEAIRRWPDKAGLFAPVKDDGRAEAALIAVAGLLREPRR